jgi:hypothetical protein
LLRALGLAFLLTLFWVHPSSSQGRTRVCADRSELVKVLNENHGEYLIVRAVNENGFLIEFFATEIGDTWTALISPPGSPIACVFDLGVGIDIENPFSPTP